MTHAPDLADGIDDLLPQTQCTRCGYAGCRPYAEAIADGAAGIDRCPPGGDATIARLAQLVGCDAPPLDTSRGYPGPLRVAVIDEAACIGCTLCIQACPVDAIVGAQKRMHGVLSALCSGCELCVAPCPVDCITMVPLLASSALAVLSLPPADASRARYQAHNERTARRAAERAALLADKKRGARPTP